MKSVVRLTDCLDMTVVVDWDVKPQNKQTETILHRQQHKTRLQPMKSDIT